MTPRPVQLWEDGADHAPRRPVTRRGVIIPPERVSHEIRTARSVPRDIPARCHPLAKPLFAAMKRYRMSYLEMAERAGLNWYTIRAWRYAKTPDLVNLEACLNVVGLTLTVAKLREASPSPEPERNDL